MRAVSIARALLGAGRGHVADDRIRAAARDHVGRGPLEESLLCLALAGPIDWLDERAETRARVDLLIWRAGAGGAPIPELGAWLLADDRALDRLVLARSRGTLRERALAARLLAVAADGAPSDRAAELDRVVAGASELASHPEPVVWIPAVRALGRLAGRVPTVRLRLHRWHDGDRPSERRRGLAALASAPASVGLDDDALRAAAAARDPWYAASLGIAAPHLYRERPELLVDLAGALLERGNAAGVWSVAQGLAALPEGDPAIDRLLGVARERATAARPRASTEAQLWQAVRRLTDRLDGLDPDPAFPDESLERAVAGAVKAGAGRTATGAAAIARSIGATFDAMLRVASTATDADERGHALSAVEACSRAAALALWRPILRAAGRDPDELAGELTGARRHMASVVAGYLELDELDFAMRRVALRALGHLVDGEGRAGRAPAAASALAALAGSAWARSGISGARRKRFRKPVTDLLWRLGDALREETAADETGERAIGRVAAWWAICADGVDLLGLAQPESASGRARIDHAIRAIRTAAASAAGGASASSWGGDVIAALDELGAGGSALVAAVRRLLVAVDDAELALRGRVQDELAYALERLTDALAAVARLAADPAEAMAPVAPPAATDPALRSAVARAVAGEGDPGEVAELFGARVGGLLRPAVVPLVRAMLQLRCRASAEARRERQIGPYRALRQLGGGGHGEVWLVQRDGRRRFVLKRPRRGAAMTPAARDALARLIEREARLLEGLHEGKVASFIDHGWDGDTPYLVLEYLVGVDLFRYAAARLCTPGELAMIVRDVCIGLRALHQRGIVHRDLKPSNVFLRLQLPPDADETFEPRHRDPAVAPVSDALLIDFGVARLMRDDTGPDHGGPEGTIGYLSPEQAEGAEVTAASDVYALAATLFHVMTGRRFFQDRTNQTAALVAHAFERPMSDRRVAEAARAVGLPAGIVELLDAATGLDPAGRPDVDAFGSRWAELTRG